MDLKTKIMDVKCVIILCIIVSNTDGDSSTQMRFAIDESIPYNMRITESRLQYYQASTSVHCAVECQQQDQCIMFAYSLALKYCQLYYDEVTDQSNYVFTTVNLTYYKAWCSDMAGYLYYRTLDKCLFRQREKMDFGAAVANCVNNGGSLFEPRTASQLQHFVQYATERFWIGGNGVHSTRTWSWITGGEILEDSELWVSGKPNGNFHDLCIEARPYSRNSKYGYDDRDCNYIREFYCQL